MPDTAKPASEMTVTQDQRLQLIGLCALARHHDEIVTRTIKVMEKMLGGWDSSCDIVYDQSRGSPHEAVDWAIERSGARLESEGDDGS